MQLRRIHATRTTSDLRLLYDASSCDAAAVMLASAHRADRHIMHLVTLHATARALAGAPTSHAHAKQHVTQGAIHAWPVTTAICKPPTPNPPTPQVGFHNEKLVYRCKVEKKNGDIIKRLEKSQQEKYPDLAAEKEVRERGG